MEHASSESFSPHMSIPPIVAFVPARGGSKSIPGKNLTLLNGQPLIDFTLDLTRTAGLFDETIVSTEDKQIAAHAQSAGCSIHQRPIHLATDSSRVVDAIEHAAISMQIHPDAVIVVLQPTSPLRGLHSVQSAVELHHQYNGAAVIGVVECEHHPHKTVRIDNGRIAAFESHTNLEAARQDLPKFFRINGAIYLCPLRLIIKERTLIPKNAVALRMSRVDSLDIDENIDLQFAEFILQQHLK
jgi:CMP-N-acetylneuraminic acid synthetase